MLENVSDWNIYEQIACGVFTTVIVAFLVGLIWMRNNRKTSPLPHILSDGRVVDIPVMDGETRQHHAEEAKRILERQNRN